MNGLDLVDLEYLPGTEMVRAIRCRKCGETVGQADVDAGDIDKLAISMSAHFEIRHQIAVSFLKCSDPSCTKAHGGKDEVR